MYNTCKITEHHADISFKKRVCSLELVGCNNVDNLLQIYF